MGFYEREVNPVYTGLLMYDISLKVLKELEKHGYKAFIVGGFVRDYILGIESKDVDICTNATPKEIMAVFKDSALPKMEYGAVTLFYKKKRFEITTFRREIRYLNNRKPVEIEYINDLLEDLKRRDFRMNTLCLDKSGNILDYLNGRDDIDGRVINTVGDPDYKFSQDSLRILRAVRFATTLNFKLSDEVKAAIIRNKSEVKDLSFDRKKQELDKIFASSNISYGISLIKELGLDFELGISNLNKVPLNSCLLAVWASIDFKEGYVFTSNEREIINNVREVLKAKIDIFSLYKYGLYVNQLAADILKIDKCKVTELYESLPIRSRKEIDITSKDIMDLLNKKPGSYFRDIYSDLERKILKKELNNTKKEISSYILKNYS